MQLSPLLSHTACTTLPWLKPKQLLALRNLERILIDINSKINLISRKDVKNTYIKHIIHSLLISKVVSFIPGALVMDAGTGGGFPGLPLAIAFPEVNFHLVDSIRKKAAAVTTMVDALQLENVRVHNERVENMTHRCDFIVSRAVVHPAVLCKWTRHLIKPVSLHNVHNGLLYLRGDEPLQMSLPHHMYPLRSFCAHPFFETKQLLHVPLTGSEKKE